MTTIFEFPNAKYVISLTGTERETYMNKLKDVYTSLNSKGYAVPSVTIEGTGDDTFIKSEVKNGKYITVLFNDGTLTEDKARKLSPRVMEVVDKVLANENVQISNTHSNNVVYDTESDKIYLMDLTQNSEMTEYRNAKKFNQAYLDLLEQQRLKEEQEQKEKEEAEAEAGDGEEAEAEEEPVPDEEVI
jgi:hypothetical protein